MRWQKKRKGGEMSKSQKYFILILGLRIKAKWYMREMTSQAQCISDGSNDS